MNIRLVSAPGRLIMIGGLSNLRGDFYATNFPRGQFVQHCDELLLGKLDLLELNKIHRKTGSLFDYST